MTHVFFATEAEGVATWWRIRRRDGVTLGLTSHDRNLWFDGVLHRTAPGMVPSAIRRTADLSADSAEVTGALAHGSISATDLANGRFDGAQVEMGVVDWETLHRATLYVGEIGSVSEEAGSFGAELLSAKSELDVDLVPRTSPTCRAAFCGPGCTLNPARFTHEVQAGPLDHDRGRVVPSGIADITRFADGWLRWIDGPHAGATMQVAQVDGDGLLLDQPIDPAVQPGARALLREGCDHTIATCTARFANAANFRGEPFLPGNDLLTRYPTGQA